MDILLLWEGHHSVSRMLLGQRRDKGWGRRTFKSFSEMEIRGGMGEQLGTQILLCVGMNNKQPESVFLQSRDQIENWQVVSLYWCFKTLPFIKRFPCWTQILVPWESTYTEKRRVALAVTPLHPPCLVLCQNALCQLPTALGLTESQPIIPLSHKATG